ncbi:NDP-sugar synthase [Amycolatopsis sp. NPDC048633]|uniref:nucleotidyltransferase family protein n=1 Tax=Amycolatopsis sp. NPDC048633 TaxID=3157095 RepID=UPI0033FD80C2
MISSERLVGAILAGGSGARIRDFSTQQKPLVEVLGRPVIDHTVVGMAHAGINEISIGTNELNVELLRHLQATFPGIEFIPVSTDNCSGTGNALLAILDSISESDVCIGTADTVIRLDAIKRMIDAVGRPAVGRIGHVLATRFIADEDPIWIETSPDWRLTRFSKGGKPAGLVFANIRWLSREAASRVRAAATSELFTGEIRASVVMRFLMDSSPGAITCSVEDPVFDIDRGIDVKVAEEWIRDHPEKWNR